MKIVDNNLQSPGQDKFEINLLGVVIVLAKYIKLIVAAPLVASIIALIVTFQSPNFYTADTTFMPPKQASSALAIASLSALPGMFGGGGGIMLGTDDIYIALLNSRTMQDAMIKRFKLMQVYKTTSQQGARGALAGATQVKSSKDGLIHIMITETNPKRAALLANGYVDALLQMNNEQALSEANRNRNLAEEEFIKAKNRLGDAELAIKQLQEQTGFIMVGPQIGMLQATIKSTELELADMRAFATPNNPEYIRTRQKLDNLRAEIGKAQAGSRTVSNAPERILDFTKKTKELKYAEALYEMALQQLTLANISAAKSESSIRVIDRALVPEHKSGPFRSNSVAIAAIAALFVAVIIAFLIEAYQRSKTNGESVEQMKTIRGYLRWN